MPRAAWILAALLLASTAGAEDVTLLNWNILNYPGTSGTIRNPYFRTVIGATDPDLIVVQEVHSQAGVNEFLTEVLEVVAPGEWVAGPFQESYDTDRAIFYRTGLVTIPASGWLDTDLRNIEWWRLRHTLSGEEFVLFTLHLKASQGSDNEQRRLEEATVLRDYLDGLPETTPVIVAGDFNIYRASEPAYQLLLSAGCGQLHDPIDQVGEWHNNLGYAPIHTQSTRTSTGYGGGATGGMDDRFDQVLVTDEWLDGTGIEIRTDTYTAYGNDGEHFNQSIIEGGNSAVPYEVAEALFHTSDHLPVRVELDLTASANVATELRFETEGSRAARLIAGTPSVRLRLPDEPELSFQLVDPTGRVVVRGPIPSAALHRGEYRCRVADLPAGAYIACLRRAGQLVGTERFVLVR